MTPEELAAVRADVLAWQMAPDGSDTKALLGLRMVTTALDALPALLAHIDAITEAVETEWYNGNIDESAADRLNDLIRGKP